MWSFKNPLTWKRLAVFTAGLFALMAWNGLIMNHLMDAGVPFAIYILWCSVTGLLFGHFSAIYLPEVVKE